MTALRLQRGILEQVPVLGGPEPHVLLAQGADMGVDAVLLLDGSPSDAKKRSLENEDDR